jgi:uncharacterized Zn finger protein
MPNATCPKCGEDRQVERIRTGRQEVFFCAICGHSWPKALPTESHRQSGRT